MRHRKERVHAGLVRARAQGKVLGRPRVSQNTEGRIKAELAKGTGILKIAKTLRVGVGTVQRIKRADVLVGRELLNS